MYLNKKTIGVSLTVLTTLIQGAQAAGSKPAPAPAEPQPSIGTPVTVISAPTQSSQCAVPGGGTGGGSIATPVRRVVLGPVSTMPFQLPNGSRVDLSADLNAMLTTVVTETDTLAPADTGDKDDCDTHLELRPAVSSIELAVTTWGVTFGYTAGKEKQTIASATGKATVNIGTISMDFSLWECHRNRCTAVAATSKNHKTTGVDLSLEIDFSVVTTGATLVHNTNLGLALRKIMSGAMADLSSSSRLSELSWNSVIRAVPQTTSGAYIIGSGLKERLKPGDLLTVYAVEPATGVCNVYQPIAVLRLITVDLLSSKALLERTLEDRLPVPGDVVMVRVAQ